MFARILCVFVFGSVIFDVTSKYTGEFVCQNISKTYSPKPLQINIPKAPKPNSRIILYWGSDPARAAAALFATIIQDALGYERVTVRYGSHKLKTLITHPKLLPYPDNWQLYREIALVLSTAWEPTPTPTWENDGMKVGMAGPRLQNFGSSSIPATQELHVYLPAKFKKNGCTDVTRMWNWYANVTGMPRCGFDNATISDGYLTVYGLSNERNMAGILIASDQALLPRFRYHELKDRKSLLEMLQADNRSILFIDYKIWTDHEYVQTVNLPPCLPHNDTKCLLDTSLTVSMRIGDVSLLKVYATKLFSLAYNYELSVKSMREILETEGNAKTVTKKSEEIRKASCKWASEHHEVVDKWVQRFHTKQIYKIAIFHCAEDPDFEEYDKLLNILQDYVDEAMANKTLIKLIKYDANCSDVNYLTNKLHELLNEEIVGELIGAVVGGLEGMNKASKFFSWAYLPTILYKADSMNTDYDFTWFFGKHSIPLAIATHHFLKTMSWTRVAVISNITPKSTQFLDTLIDMGGIVHRNYLVPLNLSTYDVENVLREIQNAGARIVLVNTNAEDALAILFAAKKLGMNDTYKYTWIIHERLPDNIIEDLKIFTISTLCQGGKDIPATEGRADLRDEMDELWINRTWPAQAVPLTDAVLTLVDSFNFVVRKYPDWSDNIRNITFTRLIQTHLSEGPIKGLIQNLTYKDGSLENILVFIEEWPEHQNRYNARWRVNTIKQTVHVEHEEYNAYFGVSIPRDGTSKCIATSGDPFLPTCYDDIWSITLVLMLVVGFVIALLHYCRRYCPVPERADNELTELKKVYKHQFIYQYINDKGYVVKRTALKIWPDSGSAKFCRNRLGSLYIGGKVQVVAIKTLCGHFVDTGILREACILTSLKHDHIISLAGVCFDKPPLVLMDTTFFGNLLHYLQFRRCLLEDIAFAPASVLNLEATYISGRALTRLALQASSALEYLSKRGVIHRNVSASSCLLDSNRSLKLSGFCMATDNESGTKIPCMQRDLMSIQGMAPECFQGFFSTASDIWAFGVLVFELVTLGSSPYGKMPSSLIEEFVTEGGFPRMPLETSSLANDLVQRCWRRDPEHRMTAAEVVEYLTREPNALCPALKSEVSAGAVI